MHDRERAISGSAEGVPVTTFQDVMTQPADTLRGFFDGDPLALVIADPGHERDAERVADRIASIDHPHRLVRPERL